MNYELDTTGFANEMTAQLKGAANGYALELRSDGETVVSLVDGNAIDASAEAGASTPWSTDVSMHIASCSKLISAMALTKLIADTPGLSPSDQILPYLPAYWEPGDYVEQITFADVMAQTSGLADVLGPGVPPDQTYVPCREGVENGVADQTDIGNRWNYTNINFVLCRVLMATVGRAIDVGFNYTGPQFPPDGAPIIVQLPGQHVTQLEANDEYWDAVTVKFYAQYVQDNVFERAGVEGSLWRPDLCALAYAWPADGQPGWNSGDLMEWAGPAGYHMSVRALLDVMGTFRRGGTIMSSAQAEAMLVANYGIDWGDNGVPGVADGTPAGPLYCKNGGQSATDARQETQQEQSGAVFLPLNMECVLFVNSPIVQPSPRVEAGSPRDAFLLSLITQAFIDNLKLVPAQSGGRHPGSG